MSLHCPASHGTVRQRSAGVRQEIKQRPKQLDSRAAQKHLALLAPGSEIITQDIRKDDVHRAWQEKERWEVRVVAAPSAGFPRHCVSKSLPMPAYPVDRPYYRSACILLGD